MTTMMPVTLIVFATRMLTSIIAMTMVMMLTMMLILMKMKMMLVHEKGCTGQFNMSCMHVDQAILNIMP
jgi:hypothetical protein